MVVVVGHAADQVLAALDGRTFEVCRVDPDAEMLSSVKAGLQAARDIQSTADILLHPADHPQVARETIERLIRESAENTGRAVMPEHAGRGGHPVLIPATMLPRIRDFTGPGGLRQFWLENADQCTRIAIDDPGVVLDIDTPADYEKRTLFAPRRR